MIANYNLIVIHCLIIITLSSEATVCLCHQPYIIVEETLKLRSFFFFFFFFVTVACLLYKPVNANTIYTCSQLYISIASDRLPLSMFNVTNFSCRQLTVKYQQANSNIAVFLSSPDPTSRTELNKNKFHYNSFWWRHHTSQRFSSCILVSVVIIVGRSDLLNFDFNVPSEHTPETFCMLFSMFLLLF